MTLAEAHTQIEGFNAAAPPAAAAVAAVVETIKPSSFENMPYDQAVLNHRNEGEPLLEDMNITFKGDLTVIYVKCGTTILRHMYDPVNGHKTTVHKRRGL